MNGFYKASIRVEGAICFAVICWGSSIRASDSKKLNKPIKLSGSVLETTLRFLELIVIIRMLAKAVQHKSTILHIQSNSKSKPPKDG